MTARGTLASIGDVSSRTGVSITALRYYDEIGLVSPTTRIGGKRRFDERAIGRVNFVVRAKEAGFTLDEIGEILDERPATWATVVDSKLRELRERQRRLGVMIDMLEEVRECGCDVLEECPSLVTSG